jgi:hypothetical protein
MKKGGSLPELFFLNREDIISQKTPENVFYLIGQIWFIRLHLDKNKWEVPYHLTYGHMWKTRMLLPRKEGDGQWVSCQ